MKVILTENQSEIRYYAETQETPAGRYRLFQKYLLLDGGIGSTIEDVTKHFQKLHAYIGEDKKAEAMQEAKNLHFNHYAILEQINFKGFAMSTLIHSVNGVLCDDLSEEGLQRTRDLIETAGITQGDIENAVEDVKKKLQTT